MNISIKNISFQVDSKKILDAISFSISTNDKLLIKGKSGSGKSTLLKIMLRFLEPTQGKVIFNDTPLTSKTCHTLRKTIGYIGQKPLHYNGTAEEFLHLPYSFKYNRKMQFSKEYCDTLMNEFSLPHELYDKQYSILSGGEQQRLCILQSLLIKKECYILDEITANLDAENSEKTAHYFSTLPDCTVIVVSHDTIWEKYAKRILQLDHGMLIREEK